MFDGHHSQFYSSCGFSHILFFLYLPHGRNLPLNLQKQRAPIFKDGNAQALWFIFEKNHLVYKQIWLYNILLKILLLKIGVFFIFYLFFL